MNSSYKNLKESLPQEVKLVAVSKTRTENEILELYNQGQRDFGENKVQELVSKYENLPKNIQWHLIGHLQVNKVKYIANFVHLIHSVDSEKLAIEINKQAQKHNRIINILLQIKIADEETKFGVELEKVDELYKFCKGLPSLKIVGLMGMATNTDNQTQIKQEFKQLHTLYSALKNQDENIQILSMGMSQDYNLAISQGSNMIRIGSLLFGERKYN